MTPADSLPQLHAQRHTLKLPHIHLSYIEWLQGDEPVLFLHGLADNAMVWASAGECLRDRYHSVALDLRGHGDSSKPEQGYSCTDVITDLNALMQHLGWTSAHVVAHSWAAKVALVWARQQPDRVRSLVLVDPAFINKMPGWMRLTFPLFYRVLSFLRTIGPFETYEQAEAQAKQLKQYRGWSPLQQLAFQSGTEQKPNGQWGSKFVVQARDGVFEDVLSVAALTQSLDLPILLIQPELGLNRTSRHLQPYRRYLTNLTIQKVVGNHWCFLGEPAAFNQAIVTFLDRQRQPQIEG
ncbi:alpha/beta fold hydrolase [Pantanalinema sp. GBBB05]|uniref:alpha/beta fold hydrolase n=1 Tax=Pantanalinema sp. GBBB05 TaxID=2604139 RepID=UPI001E185734|nr:alpha/beta hydrolase [Pantanalinema sp. GBBB05]